MRPCVRAAVQELQFPQRPPPPKKSKIALEREKSGQKQMLVQANEINYDYANNRVAAVGNVQIYYGDSTLEANRVIYDQKTKRLHAEGNVRLTEQDGKVTYGEIMDLSDDYRDGFVDSLRLDAPDQTRMAATRAERSSGNYTVFHNGVYTAWLLARTIPKKPPLWQVKAARIIHDQGEKMMYFEDARLEFFGRPSRGCRTSLRPIRPSSARPASSCRRFHRVQSMAARSKCPTTGHSRPTTTPPSRR